ncbi:MAG: long-chain fatty acid--CoA ligase [Armatimonadetes bacterium]|nr:long-chain fatty acid--CoA ligase [Armatimonadota bacterium]
MGMTLNELVQETFSRYPDRDSLGWKVDGKYQFVTYSELSARVRRCALGLQSQGVESGDRVGLLSENRWEWAVTDLAILSLGAVNVPMFPTLPSAQVKYVLEDSSAKAIVVSNKEQFKKIAEIKGSLEKLEHVIVLESAATEGLAKATSFGDMMDRGAQIEGGESDHFDATWRDVKEDDLASIIYTSGTTGDPKGAMLSHSNFSTNARATAKVFEFTHEDRFLSFLPLSHVFERLAGHYLPLHVGAAVGYAESLFTIAKNLRELQPTIMLSVPRLYENMQEKILDSADKLSPTRKKVFLAAIETARDIGRLRGQQKKAPLLLEAKHKAFDTMVYQQIRESFGGCLRIFVSGGAPLPPSLGEFFCGLGITIIQGYGLTESSPVICTNRPHNPRFDSVGFPIDEVEVKIAPDGEILCKGPNVMLGYYGKPEQTREAIDEEGWLHTGDIGVLDPDGHLRITDRKKNILVLANGKNVAPSQIESHLLQSPYLSQIVLLGDRQKSVTALIVPGFGALKEYLSSKGIQAETNEAMVEAKETRQLIKAEIDRLSGHLADFEKVKKFTLLPKEFSVEEGELTPTLKIKRKVIMDKCARQIEDMAD